MKDLSYYGMNTEEGKKLYRDDKKAYRALSNARQEEFISDLAEHLKVPKLLVDYAWEQSHAYGLYEVIDTAEELAELFKEIARNEELAKLFTEQARKP